MHALYECKVAHCRLKPKRHAFNYKIFMFSVDLDELPSLAKRTLGLSYNRWNLFSIDAADHVNLGQTGGIRPNLLAWMNEQGLACPEGMKIQLVTFPRVFGYGFNPVSFYYLKSSRGEPFAVIAEVVNTYREMKLYLIESQDRHGVWHRRVAKNFYVSPFSDPALEFDFRLGELGARWQVNIDSYDADGQTLLSSVKGESRELTSLRLLWYGLKYPMLSVQIIFLIHWHAFLLWIKRVPYFRKSERLTMQRDVMRPHSSIKEK